jgi:hypothetical protein
MLELLSIAPKNETRPEANARAVNCKYSTHFNPTKRVELRIAVVGKRQFRVGPGIDPWVEE